MYMHIHNVHVHVAFTDYDVQIHSNCRLCWYIVLNSCHVMHCLHHNFVYITSALHLLI